MNSFEEKLKQSIVELTCFDNQGVEEVFGFLTSKETEEIRSQFNTKRFRLQEFSHIERLIQEGKNDVYLYPGIINEFIPPINNEQEEVVVMLSMVEVIWLTCVSYMIDFGLPGDQIKEINQRVILDKEEGANKYPLIQYFLFGAIAGHLPVFFMIYTDGRFKLVSDEDYLDQCQADGSSNHLIISINQALKDTFPDLFTVDPIYVTAHKTSLKHGEWELIKELRSGNYQSIKVRMKGNEIDLLEGVERLEVNKRLVDILKLDDFQNIDLRQENGRVVSIQRTLKKKL